MSTPAAVQKPAIAPSPPRPSRMTIANVTRGKVLGPARIIVYGVDGVGKSTFAAGAPNPIFLGTEDGTRHLDVARFPAPQTWAEVLEAIRNLTLDAGGFKTFVV